MAESRRPSRRPSKTPTATPPKKAAIGSMVKPADLASLARSFQALKQRLAEAESELKKEKQERDADADTIAQMLVRIVALERGVREAAAAGARARDSRPPPVDALALHRVAALEVRADEAEARARNADARAAAAEAQARAETERAETLARDYEALRAKLADAEVRARSEADRAAHEGEVARAAKLRAIELAERLELGTPVPSRTDGEERARHQRELDDLRARNEAALRSAHDAYAEAFRATLEDERQRAREEVEEQRAANRALEGKLADLGDRLRALASKHQTELARLGSELASVTFDRDAADHQAKLALLQLQAAEAKLQLVDKQLEWAEEVASAPPDELGDVLTTLAERLASARSALFVEDSPVESVRPPPLPSDGGDDERSPGGKSKRRR